MRQSPEDNHTLNRGRETGDRFTRRLIAVTAALAVLMFVWQTLPFWQNTLFGLGAAPRAVTARGELAGGEKATIEVFEESRPSVVYINTAQRVIDPWTRNILQMPRGSGSGFIFDELGHVVTNWHVVKGASDAIVRLADGRSFRAKLVGQSPAHDLAVLRILVNINRPRPLPIGTSGDLQVGQMVLAIGNPFGLDWTLTKGIVSALGRELPADDGTTIRDLIQTDAAINPGNSGGPLLDSAGRLIGVNTAIYSATGSNAGIGFAVPVDAVNRVVPQLIAKGRYDAPSIGVRIDPRADSIARREGTEGVVVLGTVPGSGAAEAGLTPARILRDGQLVLGDVIVGVAGNKITDSDDLRAALEKFRPGDKVTVTLMNDNERREIEITLGSS